MAYTGTDSEYVNDAIRALFNADTPEGEWLREVAEDIADDLEIESTEDVPDAYDEVFHAALVSGNLEVCKRLWEVLTFDLLRDRLNAGDTSDTSIAGVREQQAAVTLDWIVANAMRACSPELMSWVMETMPAVADAMVFTPGYTVGDIRVPPIQGALYWSVHSAEPTNQCHEMIDWCEANVKRDLKGAVNALYEHAAVRSLVERLLAIYPELRSEAVYSHPSEDRKSVV